MLAVRSRFAPDRWRGEILQPFAIARHALAVAFHLQLLDIGWQALQATVVRRHAARRVAEKAAVPHHQQPHLERQVVAWRCVQEMLVHLVCAIQEGAESIGTDGNRQRQANRRPDRITATDPVPETEGRFDAECRCSIQIRGDADKVIAHRQLPARLLPEPVQRGARIGHGFQCGKGLAGDDEQGVLRLQLAQHPIQLVAIDIADEMETLAALAIRLQRLHRHARPQVRSANADMHHIGDLRMGTHRFGKRQEIRAHGIDLLPETAQRLRHAGRIRAAQQPVHHGALLGAVDRFAAEHGIAQRQHLALFGQLHQQPYHLAIGMHLGGIDMQQAAAVACMQGLAESLQALGVLGKGLAQVKGAQRDCRLPAVQLVDRETPRFGQQRVPGRRVVGQAAGAAPAGRSVCCAHAASINCSSLTASAAKARMPSASFSVAMASSFRA